MWHHCYHRFDVQNIDSNQTVVSKILTRCVAPMRVYEKIGIGLRINRNDGKSHLLALAATAEVKINFAKTMCSVETKLPIFFVENAM